MTNKKWTLLILFIAGLIILLWPDTAKPLIEFNEKHGPSLLDIIGLTLILTSWLLGCIIIAGKWQDIRSLFGVIVFSALIIIYLLAITGIVLSLLFASDIMLWLCAGIAGSINILFVVIAFSKQ